jgi:hypothetical protein
MPENQIINVGCQCGTDIARYEKEGRGRLQKMFLSNVLIDYTGQLLTDPLPSNGTEISCIGCEKRVATIMLIHGRPAAKMNQGAIKRIRT